MIENSLIYLFSGVLVRAVPFLLLPILTHYLPPTELGKLAIFQALMLFILPFTGMNMHNNISRNFTKYKKPELAKLIGNLVYVLIFSTLVTLVSLLYVWFVSDNLIFGISKNWLLIFPLLAAFNMLNQFNLTVLRNQELPWKFAKLAVSNTILNLGISLLFVVFLGMSWEGRALGIVFSSIIFGLIGIIFLYKSGYLSSNFDRVEIKQILYVSLPLIPHALGGIIIAMSGRVFIEEMASTEILGIYLVGSSFGMIVNIFVEAFNRSWSPWVYKKLNNTSNLEKREIVKYSYISFVSYLILSFIITGISYLLLPYMVSQEYHQASQFILWVAVAYAFRGMYTIVFPYFVHSGKTYYLGFISGLIAIVSIALNYFLILKNGPIGAAQALCFSWFFMFLLTWGYSYKAYKMPWFRREEYAAQS